MIFGIGTGDPSFLKPLGRRPLKLRSLRELVVLSRQLLDGETVSSETAEIAMWDAKLAQTSPYPMPIYIAATGPKTLALCAQIADGIIAHVGTSPASLNLALSSCREQGNKRPIDFTPYVYLAIEDQTQAALAHCANGAKTIALRAPHLARAAGCSAEQEQRLRQGDPDIDDIISTTLIDKLTLSGTLDQCVSKLDAIAGLGIEHVTLYPRGNDIGTLIDTFGRKIMPLFS